MGLRHCSRAGCAKRGEEMRVLALDIGGTAIKAALFEDGTPCDFLEHACDGRQGGEVVLQNVFSVVGRYFGYACVGISTAGQVDADTGTISYANQNIPGYTGMPLAQRVAQCAGVPAFAENDVNCAAMGEAMFGAARGVGNFLMLTYGTGIGGCVIQNGQVYRGAGGNAGELGHMVTHANGRLCACGGRGCYEQYASTTALVAAAAKVDAGLENGRQVMEAAEAGNAAVQEVFAAWLCEVEAGLAGLVHLFDPGCIVLGGGIMARPGIVDSLQQSLPKRLMPPYCKVPLRAAQLGNMAGLYGAVHNAQIKYQGV